MSGPGGASPSIWRLAFVTAVWLATFRLLAEHGVRLLPLSIARELTLQSYLVIVHVVTIAIGLGASALLLPRARRALGISAPAPWAIAVVLLAAPAVYVASTYVAVLIARPTLLEEIARGGRELAQRSTGEFGRSLTQSPLGLTLLWGVVVSPLSEELLFRGAFWSTIQAIADRLRPKAESDAPASLELPLAESAGLKAARAVSAWLLGGGIATLVTAIVFAALHADMPGGLGIVRVVSAFGIGLACGVARHHSGGLLAPIVLHVAYNALSLATTRRWVITETFPTKMGVPTLLSLIGALLLFVLLGLALVRRHARAR